MDVERPLPDERAAREWLASAGEDELETDVAVLARALHAYRVTTADAYLHPPGRRDALVGRIGYGAGEEVADGRWTEARELRLGAGRQRRAERLGPHARLAALLGGREQPLACEELVLRARLDIDEGRPREAALQVRAALDAALAELGSDAAAPALRERVEQLRQRRERTERVARSALSGPLAQSDRDEVRVTLERIEAALRARTSLRD